MEIKIISFLNKISFKKFPLFITLNKLRNCVFSFDIPSLNCEDSENIYKFMKTLISYYVYRILKSF